MAKRSKTKKKVKVKKNKELSNKIRHLETLLKYTLNSVTGRSEELDLLFTAQAARIRKQINELS